MTASTAASLVNLLGFITGAILYGMLLWMVLQSKSSSNAPGVLTGLLGMAWNVGSFAGNGLSNAGLGDPRPIVLAAAFGALCFLPAVVVHSVARTGEWDRGWTVRSVGSAYAMSAVAAAMHVYSAVVYHTAPSQIALRGMTIGFGILIGALLLRTRRQPGQTQALWVLALSVFAISALHLSYHEGGEGPWWLELIGHNASVPLAVAILYQDYRFAFADLFLKRALSFVLIVGLVFTAYVFGVSPLISNGPLMERDVLALIAMWVATALVYPWIRRNADRFIDRVVLRRVDYASLLADITRSLDQCDTPIAIMDRVASSLESALTARSVICVPAKIANNDLSVPANAMSAVVSIPTVEDPHFVLQIGELSGGRRLLSDDTALIERVALLAARRIDAIRSMSDRYERDLREQEMRKLAAEAELRALRAQINPHFLFNALTTIGYLIQTAPDRALGTLLRLSGLLRSVLRTGEDSVPLGDELDLIEAYLDIERARFEDRLRVNVDVSWELRRVRIPALVLQPLVENAIKHGISSLIGGGEVRISAALLDSTLVLTVTDTGIGAEESDFIVGRTRGVGLENVERRIHHYGGEAAKLTVQSSPGSGTRVEIRIPVDPDMSGRLAGNAVTSGSKP